MNKIKQFISSLSVALLIFFSAQAYSDDTEIYLGGTPSTTEVKPNVLFVLDTSSSMTSTDGTGITRLQRMKTALKLILDDAENINVGLMRFHREGGPVLYPIADLDADVSTVEGLTVGPLVKSKIGIGVDDAEEALGVVTLSSSQLDLVHINAGANVLSFEKRVATGNDDAEEDIGSTGMSLGSTDLEFVDDSGDDQIIGIRFQNITIPAAATILSAEIEFEIDEFENQVTNLAIQGQLATNPPAFSNSNGNISTRPRTVSSAVWATLPVKAINEKLITPDLTTIVQELISQPGWLSNNSMAFIVGGLGKRTVESFDGEAGSAALLRIEYSIAAAAAADQTVGLRFQEVAIPQGATITSANIEFEAKRDDSGATSLTITGEDHGDSPAFVATNNNLSSRTKTTALVNWAGVPAWTDSVKYQTPDITSVIQEIVNRGDWCGNNALTLFLDGTGVRLAKSFENSAAGAPVLNVDYDEASVGNTACINQSFQAQISSDSDDAEEAADGSVGTGSSDLELVEEGSTQTIGLRFRNVNIPQGTTILDASIKFTVDETNSGATTLDIHGEKSGDAATFTTTVNDITSRTLTTASTSWSPVSWSVLGNKHNSSDITAVIQEIVDQGTWATGNSLALIISGSGKRVAVSFDGDPSSSAVLQIRIQGKLGTGDKTVKSRLKDIIDDINWKSGTPLVDTMYEAALYYRGDPVDYGTTRGNSANSSTTLSRSEYSRVSHRASYTGGTVNQTGNCSDTNLNSIDCQTENIDNTGGTPTYISPIAKSCQGNHIILLSDGFPSLNSSVSRIETLIGPATCAGSGSGKCGNELTSFLYTKDQTAAFDDKQIVKTYTIGFEILGAGKIYLEELASNGGGEFFEASSSADLVNAFQSIIKEISFHPTSFAAPSLTVNAFNKLYHDNDVYFSLFLPSQNLLWPGNIKKYRVCEGTPDDIANGVCERGEIMDANDLRAIGADNIIKSSARSFWGASNDGLIVKQGGAGAKVPTYASRRLFTYTGATAPSSVVLDSPDHRIEDGNTLLTKALLGDAAMSNAKRTDLVSWIRGKDLKDDDEDGDLTDDRWVLNDPLHGGTVSVSYGYEHTGSEASSNLVATLDGNGEQIPITKLLISSNDGSLRMINASSGEEEWAFIPQELLLMQQDLMNNPVGDHVYGLDNSATYRVYDANGNGIIEPAGTDVNGDSTISADEMDYIHAFISMRRGGRNIYALDITPSAEQTSATVINGVSPKLLWRIEGGAGDFAQLGQTWSTPLPATISISSGVKKEVLIFAGGYHPGQDGGFGVSGYGNSIYIVDAVTGARLWWAGHVGSGADLEMAGMLYAIPSDLAILDSDSDGLIDRVYVGDTGGQVLRVDLITTLSASIGNVLARVSDAASLSKQRKFFYSPDVAQIVDTVYSNKSLYDIVTILSGDRAHPLETVVQDRVYAFRDYRTKISKSIDPAIVPIRDNSIIPLTDVYADTADGHTIGDTVEDLFDATENLIQQGDATEIEASVTSIKGKDGWFIDLKEYDGSWVGEKGLSSPLILDGKMFYTTYVPGLRPANPCDSNVEGGGRLYAVDLLNASAVFDWFTGDGDKSGVIKKDRRYSLGSGIPSSAQAIFQNTGVSVIVGGGGGSTTVDPKIGLPKHRTFWMQNGLE